MKTPLKSRIDARTALVAARCTCFALSPERDDMPHSPDCPLWQPVWMRRGKAKDMTNHIK